MVKSPAAQSKKLGLGLGTPNPHLDAGSEEVRNRSARLPGNPAEGIIVVSSSGTKRFNQIENSVTIADRL